MLRKNFSPRKHISQVCRRMFLLVLPCGESKGIVPGDLRFQRCRGNAYGQIPDWSERRPGVAQLSDQAAILVSNSNAKNIETVVNMFSSLVGRPVLSIRELRDQFADNLLAMRNSFQSLPLT